jgi:hypothetical protein
VAGVECRGRAIALHYSLGASDLRLRFRHLTISDITRLAAHAAVGRPHPWLVALSSERLLNMSVNTDSYLFVCAAGSRSD